jgi:hypothetical protein
MPQSKTIRCSKCLIVMSIHQFVDHRTGNGAVCRGVPCPACGGPVGKDAGVAHAQAVCSRICERNIKVAPNPVEEAIREIDDQLAAMRRAEVLPFAYQRRRAG